MYTYLEITNLALREINEVPLTEQQFEAARGLQQFAKEAVNRAYFDISSRSTKWSWLQTQSANTANLEKRQITAGQQWYEFNVLSTTNKIEVDWDSFLLTDKDIINGTTTETTVARKLEMISYEHWLERHREDDFNEDNKGTPKYVVRFPSGKFGLSPVPDVTYYVEYNVFNNAVRFTSHTDVIPFPEQFITCLLARIKYYLWLFRENDTQANFSLGEYREGLQLMERALLSNKQDRVRAV